MIRGPEQSKLLFLQTLQGVYVLSLSNLVQENFTVKLEALSALTPSVEISSLVQAFNINDHFCILITSMNVYVLNLQNFAVNDLGIAEKIDLATCFQDHNTFNLLLENKESSGIL